MRRTTSIIVPVAHLVGPGKLIVINQHLAYRLADGKPVRLAPEGLTQIVCYGEVGVSGEAMLRLLASPVSVAWMTPAGQRCRGRVSRSSPETTGTRLRQHRALARPEAALEWAREVVLGKVEAQIEATRHLQRHGNDAARRALGRLRRSFEQVHAARNVEALRGVEGNASPAWFALLGESLRPPWVFTTRTRRPPTDPVNALLSLAYTWLLNRTVAKAEAAGLEIYLGALHKYRAGRPSLACDLMEPLRVPGVDRWVIAGCNQGIWQENEFERQPDGGFRLLPGRFGRILCSWEDHWAGADLAEVLARWVERFVQLVRRHAAEPVAGAEQDL